MTGPKPDTERPISETRVICEFPDKPLLIGYDNGYDKGTFLAVPKSAYDALTTDLAISRDAYEMQKRVSERLEKERDELKKLLEQDTEFGFKKHREISRLREENASLKDEIAALKTACKNAVAAYDLLINKKETP